jgi:hypothetical protein
MFSSNFVRPARITSVLILGAALAGCAPENMTTEPDLTAAFAKQPSSPSPKPAVFNFPSDGYSVTNDGNAVYNDGECNVTARTFVDTDGTEDANMQTGAPGGKKCRRVVRVTHLDGAVDQVTGMNVNDVGTISVGSSVPRSMNFTIPDPTKCNRIGFGNLVGGDMVTVTRGADVAGKRTWNVSFDGNGACVTPQGPTILVAVTMNFNVTDK